MPEGWRCPCRREPLCPDCWGTGFAAPECFPLVVDGQPHGCGACPACFERDAEERELADEAGAAWWTDD